MQMPRAVFEEIMSPVTIEDCSKIKRDAEGLLEPTRTTAALNYFEYEIKKGSVSDRLFSFDSIDPPPKPPPKRKAAEMLEIGEEEDVYEVEEIRAKRLKGIAKDAVLRKFGAQGLRGLQDPLSLIRKKRHRGCKHEAHLGGDCVCCRVETRLPRCVLKL